jgi:N-methylhydantoinase A
MPGPACYSAGGQEATVTDCALVLGYIDPAFFLGGAMALDIEAATRAVSDRVARRLGLGLEEAAAAVIAVATEKMVGAIGEITVNQGIDPATAVLVGGGGAAGLNCVAIARRLGCRCIIIPSVGAALSAAGALISELSAEYARMAFTTARRFDAHRVNAVLKELDQQCHMFIAGPGVGSVEQTIEFAVEARYPHQIWEIEVPVGVSHLDEAGDLASLIQDFHATHRQIFAIDDAGSDIEFVTWRARVHCRLHKGEQPLRLDTGAERVTSCRRAYFPDTGWVDTRVEQFATLAGQAAMEGPAIVESPFTTIVIDPGAAAQRSPSGGLVVSL